MEAVPAEARYWHEDITFVWRRLAAACAQCGAQLFVGAKHEDGHRWNGCDAATFACLDSGSLNCGEPVALQLVQGASTVAHATCGSCGCIVGWKFVNSPISKQCGKIGLMLNAVVLAYLHHRATLTLPPHGSDALDALAHRFMAQHGVPGLSLAYARGVDGQPITRCWGLLNESGERLMPATKLRVASVSKPITAVAILQLIDAGKLKLEDRVFAILKPLLTPGFKARDPRVNDITVRHLLHHLGGGWTNKWQCPMFQEWGLERIRLIEKTLSEVGLEHGPGTVFGYSNFGYCLLGRVIECVSGDGYEDFVSRSVLSRCGVDGAFIEGGDAATAGTGYFVTSRAAEHASVPANFDARDSALTCGLVGRMDSHGGWSLSPRDLVLFSQGLDAGLLCSEASIRRLSELPPTMDETATSWYGMGWRINQHARWHDGWLEGTRSILVKTRRRGGMHWAIVANGSLVGCDGLDGFGWECLDAVCELLGRDA